MNQATIPELVCLGNFTIDDVYLPDGTHNLLGSGGNAFYASLGGRLWETNVEIVAPIGFDFPNNLLEQIKNKNFNLEGLPTRPIATVRNEVYYDKQGERRWNKLTSEDDFEVLSPVPADIPENYYGAKIYLVSAMTLKSQMTLVSWIKENCNGLVALDVRIGYNISGNPQMVFDMISKADIFMPSEVEVFGLLGTKDWHKAAKEFANMGPSLVVIKRGEKGSLIYYPHLEHFIEVPSYSTKVIDTTGAGDSYCGGFLAMLARKSSSLEEAGCAGAISSSFTISDWGAEGILNITVSEAKKRFDHWKTKIDLTSNTYFELVNPSCHLKR